MSKWVKRRKRLPKDGQKVLCYTVGGFYGLYTWRSKEDAWEDDGQFYFPELVTHWMELPEPPKEVQNER